MSLVLADTFFWIALTNVQDQTHKSADAFARSATFNKMVTTQEVLPEYLNYFAGSRLRRQATLIAQKILDDPKMIVAAQASDSFQAGLALYRTRPDKGVQPHGLHLDGYDAPRRNCRCVDERRAL
jgi:predicted nucleic acid-binding protein